MFFSPFYTKKAAERVGLAINTQNDRKYNLSPLGLTTRKKKLGFPLFHPKRTTEVPGVFNVKNNEDVLVLCCKRRRTPEEGVDGWVGGGGYSRGPGGDLQPRKLEPKKKRERQKIWHKVKQRTIEQQRKINPSSASEARRQADGDRRFHFSLSAHTHTLVCARTVINLYRHCSNTSKEASPLFP